MPIGGYANDKRKTCKNPEKQSPLFNIVDHRRECCFGIEVVVFVSCKIKALSFLGRLQVTGPSVFSSIESLVIEVLTVSMVLCNQVFSAWQSLLSICYSTHIGVSHSHALGITTSLLWVFWRNRLSCAVTVFYYILWRSKVDFNFCPWRCPRISFFDDLTNLVMKAKRTGLVSDITAYNGRQVKCSVRHSPLFTT